MFINGTIALITALQALRIMGGGDYNAFFICSHLVFFNLEYYQAYFTDIDPITLNLDPSKIEAAITPIKYHLLYPYSKMKEPLLKLMKKSVMFSSPVAT